jgi:predicted lipoprotein with Yx(FWY)xxD motif
MKRIVVLLSFCLGQIIFANNPVSIVQVNDETTVLTDTSGRTLYTFDVDQPKQSNCHDQCLVIWPPMVVDEEQEVSEPFSVITTSEGVKQLTLNSKPLYYFFQDKNPKDILGDGINSVWHIINVKLN